jgi:hypothetical protein
MGWSFVVEKEVVLRGIGGKGVVRGNFVVHRLAYSVRLWRQKHPRETGSSAIVGKNAFRICSLPVVTLMLRLRSAGFPVIIVVGSQEKASREV